MIFKFIPLLQIYLLLQLRYLWLTNFGMLPSLYEMSTVNCYTLLFMLGIVVVTIEITLKSQNCNEMLKTDYINKKFIVQIDHLE